MAARIVESVPDLDAKFYAATQVMDEARHVELYSRFIRAKIGLYYPVNTDLARLLESTLTDSRWDLPHLGMQVLIEGLALAAFGVFRDLTLNPLVRQLLAYVMQDEARHVAFGRLALRDCYAGLAEAERAEREEFVVEGCYLMRDRFRGQEVFTRLGLPVAECIGYVDNSPTYQLYQSLLFSRIVPCVRDVGLWGPTVQRIRGHGRARCGPGRPYRADAPGRADRRGVRQRACRAPSQVDVAIADGAEGDIGTAAVRR
jgi:P-aminobenzoate N-oxygenase AurF